MAEPTSYRIDKKAKKAAYKVFDQIGLKPSQAVNLFFHQVALKGGIPFDLTIKEPNQETLQAFEETHTPENLPSFGSFKELRLDQDLK